MTEAPGTSALRRPGTAVVAVAASGLLLALLLGWALWRDEIRDSGVCGGDPAAAPVAAPLVAAPGERIVALSVPGLECDAEAIVRRIVAERGGGVRAHVFDGPSRTVRLAAPEGFSPAGVVEGFRAAGYVAAVLPDASTAAPPG